MPVDIELHHLRLPRRRFAISTGVRESVELFVVMLREEGETGLGAGTPSSVVNDSPAKCGKALARLRQNKIDPEEYFELALWESVRYDSPAASAAIDIAMWDLKGKLEGRSVAEMLHGTPGTLPTGATIDLSPVDAAKSDARRLTADGFDTIKVKVGRSVHDDVARIRAVRETVGADIRLFADANGGYGPGEATEFWRSCSELELALFEQPLPRGWESESTILRQEHGIRICADESATDEHSLQELVDAEAIDVVNVKLMKCGGLTPALRMVEIADEAGIGIMLGSMGDIGLSIAAGAHLGRAVSPEFVDLDSHLNIQPICTGPEVRRGRIELSDGPGLGIGLLEGWERWGLSSHL